MPERRSELHEAARIYARQGIPVLPFAPGTKVPLISAQHGGRGLHDATTNPARVDAWWKACPDANVGLRTGVRFDAVDLDGPDAIASLEDVKKDFELPGPCVKTPHGHHVWVEPSDHGNRAGFLPHVDYRGQGDYVLAPPSIVGGPRYRWERMERQQPVPSWLAELVHPRRDLPVTRAQLPVPSGGRATAYGAAALRRELEQLGRAAEGTRNASLNRSAFALGQLVASGALEEASTAEALLDAGLRIGRGERECERTIASGMSAGMEQPRPLSL
jgi:Bifunctional DNA primase/polymerase, N-terminal